MSSSLGCARIFIIFLCLTSIPAFYGKKIDLDSSGEDEDGNQCSQRHGLKFGKWTLPKDYDSFVLPPSKDSMSTPLLVNVSFSIRAILDIDQDLEEIVVDADFGMKWHDSRIYLEHKNETMHLDTTVDAGVLKCLWKPDISIEQLGSSKRSSLISKPVQLRVNSNGDFIYHTRMTMHLRCSMDFAYFPADSHDCLFQIRSYSYSKDQLNLSWEDDAWAYLVDPSDSNFDVMIHDVEPLSLPNSELKHIYLGELGERSGNYSVLEFYIKARRQLTYHLVQTYLPSFLLIMITWVCFLIPADMVEVRIGITMTTVLTLTALFASVRQQSPDVSYTMAVDVWMVFNILMLITTFFLFTTIYWMKRELTTKPQPTPVEGEETNELDPNRLLSMERYRKTVKFSTDYAFGIFAVAFTLFVVVYWLCLIIDSRYLNFHPMPEFNCDKSDKNATQRYPRYAENRPQEIYWLTYWLELRSVESNSLNPFFRAFNSTESSPTVAYFPEAAATEEYSTEAAATEEYSTEAYSSDQLI